MDPLASLLTLDDLDASQLAALVERSVELYRDRKDHRRPLAGLAAGMMFLQTSTRTRTAFSTAAIRLGAGIVSFGPNDLQTNTGESLEDTGRIFASMLDLLVIRTKGPTADLETLGGGALPVVNAMSADEHPTQGLNDIAALRFHLGDLTGLRLLYVGEGNNTAVALARGLCRLPGCRAVFWTPPGYGLPEALVSGCHERARRTGGGVTQISEPDGLPADADVVYTTRWQTTGTSKDDPRWRETFRPFYVDEVLLRRWPEALVMHDLPAHRGEEISAEALEGKRSIAWMQAAMKMTSAMAVLEWAARTPAPSTATH